MILGRKGILAFERKPGSFFPVYCYGKRIFSDAVKTEDLLHFSCHLPTRPNQLEEEEKKGDEEEKMGKKEKEEKMRKIKKKKQKKERKED